MRKGDWTCEAVSGATPGMGRCVCPPGWTGGRADLSGSAIQFNSIQSGGIRIQFNSIDLYGVLEEQDYPFLTWRGTPNLKEPTA
jgi:hypothetical protein